MSQEDTLQSGLKAHAASPVKKSSSSSSGSKTLTASSSAHEEASQNDDENTWGRLFPLKACFYQIDMSKDSYTFGRNVACTFSFDPNSVPKNSQAHKIFKMCSSVQFKIRKENDISNNCFDVFLEDTSKNGTFLNGKIIGQGKKVVLNNNDMIAMNGSSDRAFVYMKSGKNEIDQPEEFRTKFILSRQIGKGAYGDVLLAFERGTCIKFAVKILERGRFSSQGINFKDNTEKIMAEVNILKAINHPCIVKIQSFSMTQEKLFIVLDFVAGGDLTSKITKRELDESITKLYFYQIVLATKYLHDKGIAHRDLKLDNILLDSEEKATLVKVTDFGLSKIVNEGSMMDSIVGTPVFLAPEIIKNKYSFTTGGYSNKVDCWSLGVILYICLVGYPPFSAEEVVVKARGKSLELQIMTGDYQIRNKDWRHFSGEAQDLVKKLLMVNPKKRLSTAEILRHPWLQDDNMKATVWRLMKESNPALDLSPFLKDSRDDAVPSGSGVTREAEDPVEGHTKKKIKIDDEDVEMASVTGSSSSSMDI